jgi:hypothetical protein
MQQGFWVCCMLTYCCHFQEIDSECTTAAPVAPSSHHNSTAACDSRLRPLSIPSAIFYRTLFLYCTFFQLR